MITLGRAVEEVVGEPLAAHLRRTVFEPLGMKDTGYRPPLGAHGRCAPTSPETIGVVHDPLARFYIDPQHQSGNAGLFSTADDLAKFCRALLTGRILKPQTVERMFRDGLGWRPMRDEPFKGGVGHTGYTGTMIWMQPSSGRFAVLLTNRVYPDNSSNASRFRKEVIALINR